MYVHGHSIIDIIMTRVVSHHECLHIKDHSSIELNWMYFVDDGVACMRVGGVLDVQWERIKRSWKQRINKKHCCYQQYTKPYEIYTCIHNRNQLYRVCRISGGGSFFLKQHLFEDRYGIYLFQLLSIIFAYVYLII